MLHQPYGFREITEVFWMPSGQYPADVFTKSSTSPALKQQIGNICVFLVPNAWVKQSVRTWSKPTQLLFASIFAIFEDGEVPNM